MKIQKKLALGYLRTKLKLLSVISSRKAGEEAFRLFCTPITRYSGREPIVFAGAEKLQLNLKGDIIRGYRCNHPRQKRALILHGFASSCHKFDKYAEQLVNAGYEVLAFDAPAHGKSDGDTINAVEYCEMIMRLHEVYGPFQAFIAHSLAGIAVTLALEQLPHTAATRLVLIAPATETSTAIEAAFDLLQIKSKAVREKVHHIIHEKSGRYIEWFSIRRAIKNISAQMLWVHDEDDDITPWKDALKVKEDNPKHIRFMVTKGLGHQRIYRDAQVRNAVINFLKA